MTTDADGITLTWDEAWQMHDELEHCSPNSAAAERIRAALSGTTPGGPK